MMQGQTQQEKAQRFGALHTGPEILVLPNAWDVASARIFEEAGFDAVATTSAGLANSLGYPDGQVAPREEVLFVIRRIARSVEIPVTADIEAGYGGHSVQEVLTTVWGVLEAGAVGINLEDSAGDVNGTLLDIGLQVEKIQAIRELAASEGIPLVINARTDAFHLAHLNPDRQFALAVERANAYRAAGADCLFIPFVSDALTISALAKAVDGPLNVLAMPGTPPIDELQGLGINRVSVGAGPFRATLALVQRIARELRNQGTYHAFLDNAVPYAEANALFTRTRRESKVKGSEDRRFPVL
jgi:2-methylisocitrate lyase-like PEP mutase family enzyme